MSLRSLSRKMTYLTAAFALAAGLGVAGASSAAAVPAQNCGARTQPVPVDYGLKLTTDNNIGPKLGDLYLGYFGDCRGVYAEIRWDTPEDRNLQTGAQWLDAHVEGSIYLEDENSKKFGYVPFALTANGSTTTSKIMTIDKDMDGNNYAAPKAFYPRVDLRVAQIDQAGGLTYGPHACYISGNSHTFSDGGWQKNAGGGYCAG
ncbi:hypothetical protein ACIQPR_46780 [Streptomyces sp. NPDC091280]|uniref:hypothetical protein n=1 Tax=Streptomyces sp. NPDC091280 TaxID=3365984 RepID=UPI00381D1923